MRKHGSAVARSPWTYFAATFVWTWGLGAILVLAGGDSPPQLATALLVLAMIGPGVTGIVFTHLRKPRKGVRDYWKRVVDLRRVPPAWLLAAVALPFALQLLAGLFVGACFSAAPERTAPTARLRRARLGQEHSRLCGGSGLRHDRRPHSSRRGPFSGTLGRGPARRSGTRRA